MKKQVTGLVVAAAAALTACENPEQPASPARPIVVAFNGQGDSPSSNTDCTSPPAGPAGLTVTGIDLAWIDNSCVEDGYEVLRLYSWSEPCPENGACNAAVYYSYAVIVAVPANSTSYSDTGVYGSEWLSCYMVVATKDGGLSDFSNEACW